jgi:hypothetical protein
MTATTLAPPGPIHRTLRALPVIGRVVRDIEREVDTIFYLITIALTADGPCGPDLGPARTGPDRVAAVPVMFVFLSDPRP